jgi:16S rRNA processing protein RimM
MAQRIVVGLVQRPHGLRGEVSVEALTAFPERFAEGLVVVWRREELERELRIVGVRPHGRRLLVKFDDVADPIAARALQGGELCVPEEDLFRAPEGFFYSHEVRGWACDDPNGRSLGVAAGLEQTPAGPLLSVETGPGKIALVPFAYPIVVRVEREARKIVLDPPAGLMEL